MRAFESLAFVSLQRGVLLGATCAKGSSGVAETSSEWRHKLRIVEQELQRAQKASRGDTLAVASSNWKAKHQKFMSYNGVSLGSASSELCDFDCIAIMLRLFLRAGFDGLSLCTCAMGRDALAKQLAKHICDCMFGFAKVLDGPQAGHGDEGVAVVPASSSA